MLIFVPEENRTMEKTSYSWDDSQFKHPLFYLVFRYLAVVQHTKDDASRIKVSWKCFVGISVEKYSLLATVNDVIFTVLWFANVTVAYSLLHFYEHELETTRLFNSSGWVMATPMFTSMRTCTFYGMPCIKTCDFVSAGLKGPTHGWL